MDRDQYINALDLAGQSQHLHVQPFLLACNDASIYVAVPVPEEEKAISGEFSEPSSPN